MSDDQADAFAAPVLEDATAWLYDEAPFGYLTTDMDGRVMNVNATLCAWLGRSAEDFAGTQLTAILTPGGRIYYATHCVPMLGMQGFVREIAVDLVCADGTRLPVLLNASVARSSQGRPQFVRVAVIDATERRAYERELVRTSDEQKVEITERTDQAARATATVSQILDAATRTLLVATDADLVVTHFNRGAQEILGWTAEEAIGRSALAFGEPGEIRRHAEALGVSTATSALIPAVLRQGTPLDWTLTTRSGARITVSLSVTEIRVDHRLLGYVLAGDDVSTRLRTEEAQAAALRREVESVARLEEADRMKDEVVSTISHELRTPIAAIQGYGEVLADGDLGDLTPPQAAAIAKLLNSTSRLTALVDNLVHLDRIDSADGLPLPREPVDLASVVAEARDNLEQLARGRQLTFDLRTPDRAALVLGDRLALERVVWNLAGNAIKFTPDGGTIDVTVSATPTSCVLTVADDGLGMSEADRSHAHERFYRSTEAYRRAVPGTGLGLSVVESIVAAHNGQMAIESTLGRGTTVTVTLPALTSGNDNAAG